MYDAMDVLYHNAAGIERSIFFHTADLLNLQVDLIFYDTTTASFSIDQEDEAGLRRFGRAKEGNWGPQVVVALAVTREGLPVRCWVFPGNTTDVDTVERVRKDLRGWQLGRALFVADAGMNSQDNQQELSRACGKYLLASSDGQRWRNPGHRSFKARQIYGIYGKSSCQGGYHRRRGMPQALHPLL
jgi:transposase